MPFAGAFDHDALPPNHRAALEHACTVLIDEFLDDIADLSTNSAGWDDTYMASYLPGRFRQQYTPPFARQFLLCTATVAWKLGQDAWLGPACFAEDLALNALIERAGAEIELAGADADFDAFMEQAFESTAFEGLLDHDEEDGAAPPARPAAEAGALRVDEWFRPYHEGDFQALHPYVVEPGIARD